MTRVYRWKRCAVGVPAALVDAAEEPQEVGEVDAAGVRDAVLAVGREHVVLRGQRTAGPDLRRLLAEALGPQPELALALQRRRLVVEGAHQHHVAQEAAQRGGVEVRDARGVHGVVPQLARRAEELDERRRPRVPSGPGGAARRAAGRARSSCRWCSRGAPPGRGRGAARGRSVTYVSVGYATVGSSPGAHSAPPGLLEESALAPSWRWSDRFRATPAAGRLGRVRPTGGRPSPR